MTVSLTPQRIAWLEQMVAEGRFASVDEAARFAVAEAMSLDQDIDLDDLDDLDWAKPVLDEALAEADRGATIPLEEYQKQMKQHMDRLRGR